jgi:hypothetical protein
VTKIQVAAFLSPTPSAPQSPTHVVHDAAHALGGLNLDQWLTIIISVVFGLSGVIFGILSRRDARGAGRRAEEKERRAEKIDIYRQLHLLALHRFALRAYSVQQRFRLAGPDGTPIEPIRPEPLLTARELNTLDLTPRESPLLL